MTQAALQLASAIRDLNSRWHPHVGQHPVLNALYRDAYPVVQVECGRKWGKTDIIEYFLWRGAMLRGGAWYYFTPEQKQAKEIVWVTNRLQRFGPPGWIHSINNTEMRITLTNGAFIKVDGSDNYESYRGIEPHGAAYDEFKDFRPEFHKAFGPNFSVYEAQLLVCGTPPEMLELEHYDALMSQRTLGKDLFNFPSWMNPKISKDWLRAERKLLLERGEGDVWEREFEAKRVISGSNSIFPMYSDAKHQRPHAAVMAEVLRDKKRMIFQIIADPGTTTVFGVLFRAINPFTRRVYRLAEIYETSMLETSTSMMMPRIQAMRDELCPGWEAFGIEWEQIYDEAAAWFAAEVMASFPDEQAWTPTSKGTKDKKVGLSLLKDQMLTEHGGAGRYLTVISDRCTNLRREIQGYRRKPDGTIPKGNDHLLDCDRYGNDFASCDLSIVPEPTEPDPDDDRRYRTPEQDLDDQSDDFDLDY